MVHLLYALALTSSISASVSGMWTFNFSVGSLIEDQLNDGVSIINASGLTKVFDASFTGSYFEKVEGSEAITPHWSEPFGELMYEWKYVIYFLENTEIPANTTLTRYMRYDEYVGTEQWIADNVTEYIYWPTFKSIYFDGPEQRTCVYESPQGFHLVFTPHF